MEGGYGGYVSGGEEKKSKNRVRCWYTGQRARGCGLCE